MAKVLSTEEFNNMLNEKKTMVIDFYADWCGPCKMMGPVIEELAGEYEDKLIAKVDVDNTPELAQKYGISGIPTVLFFKEGELAKTHVGFADKDQLKKMIDDM